MDCAIHGMLCAGMHVGSPTEVERVLNQQHCSAASRLKQHLHTVMQQYYGCRACASTQQQCHAYRLESAGASGCYARAAYKRACGSTRRSSLRTLRITLLLALRGKEDLTCSWCTCMVQGGEKHGQKLGHAPLGAHSLCPRLPAGMLAVPAY